MSFDDSLYHWARMERTKERERALDKAYEAYMRELDAAYMRELDEEYERAMKEVANETD